MFFVRPSVIMRQPRQAKTTGPSCRLDRGCVAMISMFAFAILPSAARNLTTSRTASQLAISTQAIIDPLSNLYLYGLVIVLAALVIASLPTLRISWAFWLYLAPWVLVTIGTYAAGQGISVAAVVYPMVGIVVFSLRDTTRTLSTAGWLVVLLAAFSLASALFSPNTAFLKLGGEAKDSLFAGQALAGPISHPNTLGQMLALGLPFVFFVASPVWRAAGFMSVTIALLATGSRTALTAAAIGLVVVVLWQWRKTGFTVRGAVGPLALALIYPVVFLASPWLVATSEPESYTGRGYIWRGSLALWEQSPMFGNGARAFYQQATVHNDLGVGAFHAHNLFLNTLVMAGVAGLVALFVFCVGLLRKSWALGSAGLLPLASWPIIFLSDGWFEAPTDFYAVAGIAWMTWIPFALVLRGTGARAEENPLQQGLELSKFQDA